MGVSCCFTTTRTQHSNSSAERAIATLSELILCYINYDQSNWASTLLHLLFATNDSPSDAIGGRSPLYVEMGQNPLRPLDLHAAMPQQNAQEDIDSRITRLENLRHDVHDMIQQRRSSATAYYNEHHWVTSELLKPRAKAYLDLAGISLTQFNLWPSAKWNPNFYGPFLVVSQTGLNTFRLKLLEDSHIHDIFHVSRLKYWLCKVTNS